MKLSTISKLIEMAIEKHGQIFPVGIRKSLNDCIVVSCGYVMLWYDFEIKSGYSTGVVHLEVSK